MDDRFQTLRQFTRHRTEGPLSALHTERPFLALREAYVAVRRLAAYSDAEQSGRCAQASRCQTMNPRYAQERPNVAAQMM